MRIPCPWCGSRDIGEFVYRGDASVARPVGDDGDAMFAYTYLRDNPAGWHDEHWYHAQGCRNWLVVTRNLSSHEISAARLAQAAPT